MWQRSVYHLGPSRLGNQEIISCGGGGRRACFKIHSKNDSRTVEWWALCVHGHSLPPWPNRINTEPWRTSHLTFSAVAEICGLAKHLFPREGLIPRTPEQCFIFLYHTDFFRG